MLEDYFTKDTINISPTVGAIQMYLDEKYTSKESIL
jgi:hypothetical protein